MGAIITDILQKRGFIVDWIKEGKAGIEHFDTHHYDICILDIMMPQVDGYSVLKYIRNINNTVPIILLSARVLTEDILKGFETGADDYMRKPLSIEELMARMNRLLVRKDKEEERRKTISFGKFSYNAHTLELKQDDRVTLLSPRAGDILFRLLTSEDNFLSKSKVLLELWGEDSFFNGRSLDVFISKLRKYLQADNSIRIVNVRGLGYKLITSTTDL